MKISLQSGITTINAPFVAFLLVVLGMETLPARGQVYISQYYEGASNDRWIEIYNAGSSSVQLGSGDYWIGMWTDTRRGAWKSNDPPSYLTALTGTIPATGTYLVGHGQAVAPSYAVAAQVASSITSFTGDDTLVLYRGNPFSTSNIVDSIGVYTNQLANTSISRKGHIVTGNTSTANYVESDWNTYSVVAVNDATTGTSERLGYHKISLPPSVPTGVSASDETYIDRILVKWTASMWANGYEVWRNTNNVSGSATRMGQNIAGSPFDDMTALRGITYYYWVNATNANGTSPLSSSDSGLRASTSLSILGTVSYGGSQTGSVYAMASPYSVAQSNIALSLDGVDDGVVVQAPTDALQLGTQMTMCAWINVTGQLAGTVATMLVKYEASTNRVAYLFGLNCNDGKPYATFGDGNNFSASQGVGLTYGWTHLAFTHDGTNGTWYINGQFSSALNMASIGRRGGGRFYIGRYADLKSNFTSFPGQLDDIGLWARTLTQGEIQGVMSIGLSGIEAGIAGCWNFDDGTANDLTTNSNNGQFMAGATTKGRTATGTSYSTAMDSPGGYAIYDLSAIGYSVMAYRDSSGNGSNDSWEACGSYPLNPLNVTGTMQNIDIVLQDPTTDSDGDEVSDYDEVYIYGTDPDDPDSDNDGLSDFYEIVTLPCLDPLDDDTDDDGVKDGQEIDDGTNPCGEKPLIRGNISYAGSQTGLIHVTASNPTGRTDCALSLDGVDDGVSVPSPTQVLRLSTNHSFCAWINPTQMPAGNQATILMKYSDTNRASFVASIEKSTGSLRYSIGDSDTAYSTSTISTASGWTHIAFTHDGSVGRWYVNGSLDSSLTFASIKRWGDGPLYIGRAIDLQTYFDRFGGGIDEVSLWKRTLNQAEIQALMTNYLTGLEVGLAGYWNFYDGTANDLTTNLNHGQMQYGATTTVRTATGTSYSTTLALPEGYSITNVLTGEYFVRAYRDSSGNGSLDPWEAFGPYADNPLAVTGAMPNINVTLQDPTTDSDGDGVSDYDEVYVHGTLWNNPDSDDDGMPDGDEVLAGSNPTNGESMFGFANSQPVPEGGGVVVSWPSLSNRVYRLERTTNLLLDFEPLVDDLPADPPVNTYTDGTPNVLGAYKVGVRME